MPRTPDPAPSRAELERRGRVATAMWVSLLLGVTLGRSIPALAPVELAMRGLGVAAAGYVILVRPRGLVPHRVPQGLFLAFALVPGLGAVLALARGEPGDCVNHLASLLALVAASSLDPTTLARSVRHALLTLVLGSLALGVVFDAVVLPNERAYLRPLYDGRLVGVLGAANVLGMACVLLVVVCLLSCTGRSRAGGIAAAFVGIAAASSQTALATAVIVLAVAGVLRLRRSGYGLPLVGATALLLAAAVGGLFVRLNQGRASPWPDLSQVSLSGRTDVWEYALRQDVPFTGLGQSAIGRMFQQIQIEGATGISSVHNGLLDGYLRDGVPGLVAVVAVLVALAAVVRRADLALIPVVAFVVEAAVETFPTHVPYYALTYALVLVAVDAAPTDVLRGGGSARRRLPGLEGASPQGLPDAPVGGEQR